MKAVSPALNALLTGQTNFIMADLWTIVLRNGTVLRYTDADINLSYDGDVYIAGDVLLKGAGVNWTTGLESDESEIELYPNRSDSPSMVGSIPFKEAIRNGFFDRALVRRERAFMETWGDTTPGTVVLFIGEITSAEATSNTAILHCNDLRYLLNINMPYRQYQPTCGYVFGGTKCGVNRALLTKNSAVNAGSSGSVINCDLTDAAGYFNNGVLTFLSGVNAGISRSVKYWTAGKAQLVSPFPYEPSVADTFSIIPGCSKNFAGSTQSFTASAQSGSTTNSIKTLLQNAPGYFNGGTIRCTDGANVGQTRTISNWQNGIATLSSGFASSPGVGDVFVLTAVSSNTVGSCTGYSNTTRFGGMRFVPVAETSY